jgi:prepilin-type N-terminal cleavage/methylation domain-containing protein
MRCSPHNARFRRQPRQAGLTLVEVMVAVAVMSIMIVSLYAGFTFAFSQIKSTQENVRATQILEERMEVVRLLNWDQVVNLPGYIPATFTAPFYADNPTNDTGSLTYTGVVTVAAAPLAESYSNDLRMITIELTWPSGNLVRRRQMITFSSQYGVQKYIY